MVKGDLDELLWILLRLELVILQRPRDRLGLSEHAIVHPRPRDVALIQIEPADDPTRIADGFLIGRVRGLRQFLRRLGGHRRHTQLMASLQQHSVEEVAIVLFRAQFRA